VQLALILQRRGIEAQRAHSLGVALLQKQHPAHIGVGQYFDARRRFVHRPQEVRTLNSFLRKPERIQISRRQRGH
jgi:hypothetical protein